MCFWAQASVWRSWHLQRCQPVPKQGSASPVTTPTRRQSVQQRRVSASRQGTNKMQSVPRATISDCCHYTNKTWVCSTQAGIGVSHSLHQDVSLFPKQVSVSPDIAPAGCRSILQAKISFYSQSSHEQINDSLFPRQGSMSSAISACSTSEVTI